MTTPIFDQAHPKIIELTFSFLDLGQHGKNLFIPLINSWDTANFRVLWPDWPHPFLNMFSQKKFWSTFNLCEFVSTCKKTCYFIDLLRRSGWLKNPSILLAENILAHISWTKLSPNMGFVQELFSIFFNFLHFSINLSFWTIFGAKKFFFGKLSTVIHNFIWVSSTMPKKKLKMQFQENAWTDRMMDRRTDWPYFIGTFQLPQGVQCKKNKNFEFKIYSVFDKKEGKGTCLR